MSNTLPDKIKTFISNNPIKKFSNLYLCELTDMDGNIIDVKIGKNYATNTGMVEILAAYSNNDILSGYRMALGNGYAVTDPDTIDPANNTMPGYISALGIKSRDADMDWKAKGWKNVEYDSTNHIILQAYVPNRFIWDYTDGNNQLYDITEFGLCTSGSTTASNLSMRTHARVYDDQGQLSKIQKKPNTRLTITPYLIFTLSSDLINNAYTNGLYILMTPSCLYKDFSIDDLRITLLRNQEIPSIKANDWIKTDPVLTGRTAVDSGRSVKREASTDVDHSMFIDDPYMYCHGLFYGHSFSGGNNFRNLISSSYSMEFEGHEIFSYNDMPAGSQYDSIRNIESINIATNQPSDAFPDSNTSTRVDINNNNLLDIDWSIGKNSDNYYRRYVSPLPCSQIDITSLTMYNYNTKKWDIPINLVNPTSTKYHENHWTNRLKLLINYNDIDITAWVFVNAFTNYPILAFDNSGITIAATDAYWDTSQWTMIANLSNVPQALRTKRYYIIVSGNVTADNGNGILHPVYDRTVRKVHRVIPDIEPFELTANGCPMNVDPKNLDVLNSGIPKDYSNTYAMSIADDTHEYFMTNFDLVYYDLENKTLKASYPLMFDNETMMHPIYRWKTKNGDRIIGTMCRASSPYSNPSGNGVYNTPPYWSQTNYFRIWTVGDYNDTPTSSDISLVWDTPIPDSASNANMITFVDDGYLCVQKVLNSTVSTEGIVIDIYNETQTHISGCSHLYGLNKSPYCVYQDVDESSTGRYVFKILDMSDNCSLYSTFVIDQATYTIRCIFGWKDFVYIQAFTTGNVSTVFMYDIENDVLQQLTEDFKDHTENWYSTAYVWRVRDIIGIDDALIFGRWGYNSFFIKADDPTTSYQIEDHPTASDYYKCWNKNLRDVQIKMCKNNKALMMIARHDQWVQGINLGEVLDNGPRWCAQYQQRLCPGSYRYNGYNSTGMQILYKDGVLIVDEYSSRSEDSNKIYYVPIEALTTMKAIGVTNTINAKNNPVRFWGTSIEWKVTNDLNRIINGDT